MIKYLIKGLLRLVCSIVIIVCLVSSIIYFCNIASVAGYQVICRFICGFFLLSVAGGLIIALGSDSTEDV